MNHPPFVDRYFTKQPRLRRFVTALFEHDRVSLVEAAGAHVQVINRRERGYRDRA